MHPDPRDELFPAAGRLLELTRRLAGDPSLSVDEAVYRSEKQTGSRNRAMAFLLESCGLLHDDPEEVLDCYFRACSIRVDCRDLAHIACTFAGRGRRSPLRRAAVPRPICPLCQRRADDLRHVQRLGDFAVKVGLPAKSGVGAASWRSPLPVWASASIPPGWTKRETVWLASGCWNSWAAGSA